MYPWPSIFVLFFLLFVVVVVIVVVFFNAPVCDCSKSWCAFGCPFFLSSLSRVVAGIGVYLTTHLCSFLSFAVMVVFYTCLTVAKAGVPLAVHLFL